MLLLEGKKQKYQISYLLSKWIDMVKPCYIEYIQVSVGRQLSVDIPYVTIKTFKLEMLNDHKKEM